MWCFACCRFPQHPSSAHQDPWFFQHLRYSHFSKFSTLSRYRIRGPTRSEISRQLLVWAYHEWCVRFYVRRACKVLFLPEISSQNTAAFGFEVVAILIPSFQGLCYERLELLVRKLYIWRPNTTIRSYITPTIDFNFCRSIVRSTTEILLFCRLRYAFQVLKELDQSKLLICCFTLELVYCLFRC